MNQKMIDNSFYINAVAQEAFSFLSNSLLCDQHYKIVSINSFMPGEGRTTVAVNVAIAAARSGVSTLLVDADLRSSGGARRHREEPVKGLSDYYEGMNLKDIVCRTSIKNLSFVNAGIELIDPVEFLNSDIYSDFLAKASLHHDLIIIDTPCSGKFVDGAIIAAKACGALLITSANKTSYKNIERLKWQMRNIDAMIIGVVINRLARVDYKSYFVLK